MSEANTIDTTNLQAETGLTTGATVPEPTTVSETVAPNPAQVTAVPAADLPSQKLEAKRAAIPAKTATTDKEESTLSDRISQELQNPLTKQFTQAEWEALFEFRVCKPNYRL